MRSAILAFITLMGITQALSSCAQERTAGTPVPVKPMEMEKQGLEVATLGGGCFWCVEAVYQELRGVDKVISGYAGGASQTANYRDVCSGATGHAEVVQVHFDPGVISFEDILEVFWASHDPTTLNRQGNDVGTQYRSVIFWHNEAQRERAEFSKKEVAPQLWDRPIVTEISPLEAFFTAEEYHQDYYSQHSDQPYCRAIIAPKLMKVRKRFAERLKEMTK